MAKIGFEGIGEVVITFGAKNGTAAGQTVKMTGDSEVGPCVAGDKPCGVVIAVESGLAAVQMEGFATLATSGSGIAPGWVKLVADGMGGVKADAANGRECLVVSADVMSDTAVVRL